MLSEERSGQAATLQRDSRFDPTRDARIDARYAARFDARASYVCWQRGALDMVEPSALVGTVAGPGDEAGALQHQHGAFYLRSRYLGCSSS